jgi:hypothetical protein
MHLSSISKFFAEQIENLGYWITRQGIQSIKGTLSDSLIMIDPVTGWFEIVEVTNKSATSIQDLFHNTWLARYPRPQFIVFDNVTLPETSIYCL